MENDRKYDMKSALKCKLSSIKKKAKQKNHFLSDGLAAS